MPENFRNFRLNVECNTTLNPDPIAAAIFSAAQTNVNNFSVISAHKLVPPAMEALMEFENVQIDGFILPGHVSVIIGVKGYQPFY